MQYNSFTTQKNKIGALEETSKQLLQTVKDLKDSTYTFSCNDFNKPYIVYTARMKWRYTAYDDVYTMGGVGDDNTGQVLVGFFYATIKIENGTDELISNISFNPILSEEGHPEVDILGTPHNEGNNPPWGYVERAFYDAWSSFWYQTGTTYMYTYMIPYLGECFAGEGFNNLTQALDERYADLEIIYKNDYISENA